jgi:hypothetical protein
MFLARGALQKNSVGLLRSKLEFFQGLHSAFGRVLRTGSLIFADWVRRVMKPGGCRLRTGSIGLARSEEQAYPADN